MKKILQFLASDGAFLYEDRGFRIVGSEYSPSFGGTGSVTLGNNTMELRLNLDRDRLLLDFRGKGRKSPYAWYSMDVVRQLLTGEMDKSLLDADNLSFLKQHFDEIQQRFTTDSLAETEAGLKKLEKQRSKRLFG